MRKLIDEIRSCTLCEKYLALGPRPVFSVDRESKIIIIGQAPGKAVHTSGIPWDDKSGENLRAWLGVNNEVFYNSKRIGILPMGFCYPGKGKSGDLAPRHECAPLWHHLLMEKMNNVELVLLIGKYAQDYYLEGRGHKSLTDNVRSFKEYLPKFFVLPHPSPRNNIWQAKNSWFRERSPS